MSLSIQLLGEVHLSWNGALVEGMQVTRLQELLAYLLLHRDSWQGRERVAYLFWPDSTEAQARTNLRKLWFRLRQTLPDANRFLLSHGAAIRWNSTAPFTLDVADFEGLLHETRNSSVANRTALERAVTLYRGDFLPGCYSDWVLEVRARLCDRYAAALEALVALLEQGQHYREALTYAQRLCQHDPLDESAYRTLMRLHALLDNRAAALQVYHQCLGVLARELAVPPSTATRDLYERLRSSKEVPPPDTAPGIRLIGRRRIMARLLDQWQKTINGIECPAFVLLTGEAGIGKSRLAEELVTLVRRQGYLTAEAYCYAAGRPLAYEPLVAWLRALPLDTLSPGHASEIARLLPELLERDPPLQAPGPLVEGWQRMRFFTALTAAFTQRHAPLVLYLDDIQWCDRDTLEWIHHFLQQPNHPRVMIIATLRSEELSADHPLNNELAVHPSRVDISVPPLDSAAALDLATMVMHLPLSAADAEWLVQDTEGNPLFIIESARAYRENVHVVSRHGAASGKNSTIPPRVRSLFEARLATLAPATRSLAQAAAVLGRSFSAAVLETAAAAEHSDLVVLAGLDELYRRNIIREVTADQYDFNHDRLRAVVYESMSHARRKLLHRRAAAALEAGAPSQQAKDNAEIARHLALGGQAGKAVPYFRAAAQSAVSLLAIPEALAYLDKALLYSPPPGRERAEILRLRGDLLTRSGQPIEARRTFEEALELASDALERAAIIRSLFNLTVSEVKRDEAERYYLMGHATLAELSRRSAAWWQEWLDLQEARAIQLYHFRRMDELQTHLATLRASVVQHGDRRRKFMLENVTGLIELRKNFRPNASRIDLMRRYLRYAVEEEADNLTLLAERTFDLGVTLLWGGELVEAEENFYQALAIHEQIGVVFQQITTLAYLSTCKRLQGSVEASLTLAERCMVLSGGQIAPYYVALAIANLGWVAWRKGCVEDARRFSEEAVNRWQGTDYPIRWTAHWTLLALSLEAGDIGMALDEARAMLDPTLQALPAEQAEALRAALGLENKLKEAAQALRLAVEQAKTQRYL